MKDDTILDIFGNKLTRKDLHTSLVETHEEITVAIFEEVISREGPGLIPEGAWQILKEVAHARSRLVPFLSFAQKTDNVIVEIQYLPELNDIFRCLETSVEYVVDNYEELGKKSDFHTSWTKDGIKEVTKLLLQDIPSYPSQIMKSDNIRVSSDTLKLTKNMFSLVLYAIMGKKDYDRFAAESRLAMKTLARYQREFIQTDKKTIN